MTSSNVHYSNFFPRNHFNWKRFFYIVLTIIVLYLIIFQPKAVGEHIGAWLKLLTDGFKSTFNK